MSNEEKVFADGFSFKRRDGAPDFVIGSFSVKVDSALETIEKHKKNGWLNLQVLLSKGGKHYVEVDTWEPTQQAAPQQAAPQTAPQTAPGGFEDDDSLPF